MIYDKSDVKMNRFKSLFSDENVVLLMLVFFGLFFRFLTMTNIETGGDAANIWFAAKTLFYGLPYGINHHTARFGMIIPVFLSQLVFGTHPVVYYIIPLLFFVLQVVFLFKIAVRAYGINLAFVCSILLIFLPKMFSHAIQIKPDGFCAAYILICVYFLFKFNDTEDRPYLYLFTGALFMFMAYMTKETSLFFLPGLALCILVMKRKFKYVIFFGSILFALFLGETFIYYITLGLKMGRAQIITGSHLESGNLQALPSVFSLFGRYTALNAFEMVYFFAYVISTFYLLLRGKKLNMNSAIQSLIIVPLAFFILLTFAVKSVNPVVPAMSFNPRHLVPAAPFMIFVISYAIVAVYGSFKGIQPEDISTSKAGSRKLSLRLYAAITGGLSVTCLVAVILLLPLFPQAARAGFLSEHPLVATFRYHTILNDAYAKGIPLIQEKVIADRWKKPVDAVQVYLDKGLSLQEACKKAEVTEKDYLYCLSRVQAGDYKTFKIFTHIFWDFEIISGNSFNFPEMEETKIKDKSIGFMVKESYKKEKDYKKELLSDEENPVVVMYEKPIRVKQMKLKEFFK